MLQRRRAARQFQSQEIDLRYPLGLHRSPSKVSRADLDAWIAELEALPRNLRKAVEGLSEAELNTSYRPGGWTTRQVVHHIADGHMSAYTRFRLALTEDTPTFKPFEETLWAELVDAKTGPVEPSLILVDGLHQRWVMLLRSMSDADVKRRYRHPDRGELIPLEETLSYFAWHSRHHVAQILSVKKR